MRTTPDRSQRQSPPEAQPFVVLMVGLGGGAAESIRRRCAKLGWICDPVRNGREALGYLDATKHLPPAIVLCAEILPDGSWLQLLNGMGQLLIVVSKIGDERLWAEVLNLGAYDLLPEPFTELELEWTLDAGRLEWERACTAGAGERRQGRTLQEVPWGGPLVGAGSAGPAAGSKSTSSHAMAGPRSQPSIG